VCSVSCLALTTGLHYTETIRQPWQQVSGEFRNESSTTLRQDYPANGTEFVRGGTEYSCPNPEVGACGDLCFSTVLGYLPCSHQAIDMSTQSIPTFPGNNAELVTRFSVPAVRRQHAETSLCCVVIHGIEFRQVSGPFPVLHRCRLEDQKPFFPVVERQPLQSAIRRL